jgi:hypothetical protein
VGTRGGLRVGIDPFRLTYRKVTAPSEGLAGEEVALLGHLCCGLWKRTKLGGVVSSEEDGPSMLVPGVLFGDGSVGGWGMDKVCFSTPAGDEICVSVSGDNRIPKSCPDFCCGSCSNQYCCSDVLKKFVGNEKMCVKTEAR